MTYDVKLQDALSEAAWALGADRGRRNETIAQRITAIRAERDRLKEEVEDLEIRLGVRRQQVHELLDERAKGQAR